MSDDEQELADATERVMSKAAALRQSHDAAVATIRVHEHTIRMVSTERDEARAHIATLEADLARVMGERDARFRPFLRRCYQSQSRARSLARSSFGSRCLKPLLQPAASHDRRSGQGASLGASDAQRSNVTAG